MTRRRSTPSTRRRSSSAARTKGTRDSAATPSSDIISAISAISTATSSLSSTSPRRRRASLALGSLERLRRLRRAAAEADLVARVKVGLTLLGRSAADLLHDTRTGLPLRPADWLLTKLL